MKKKIDFSGVETFSRAPEGTHIVKVATVEETTFQSGNEGFKVAFELTKGAGKGARVYENFPLQETALWKLKSLLVAIGMKADGRVTLDTDKLIGKTLELDVYHEEYDGKMRARVGEMRKPGLKDEEPDDDDIDEDDIDEEEDEEEEKPKKKSSKTTQKSSKTKKKEEVEEDDDDEDEEEEKPKKLSKKTTKKSSKKKPEPEPEDDDDDWDDDEDWDD